MAAIVPNFFSVERKGYLKVSDLFVDVMKDMLENGFNFINCSNTLSADDEMTFWRPTVVSSGVGHTIGEKLFVTGGSTPLYSGTPRPTPYVLVTSISSPSSFEAAINSAANLLAIVFSLRLRE